MYSGAPPLGNSEIYIWLFLNIISRLGFIDVIRKKFLHLRSFSIWYACGYARPHPLGATVGHVCSVEETRNRETELENQDLKKHRQIHSEQTKKTFRCSKCSDQIQGKKEYLEHRKSHPIERKIHKCEVCSRVFNKCSNLKAHALSHSHERPYACDKCDKTFQRTSQLVIHNRIHNSETPYSCDKCEKSFRGRTNLRLHLLVHSLEKPYQCEICSKSFTRKDCLNRHLITHVDPSVRKKHVCLECVKVLPSKSGFDKPLVVYFTEKPYQCESCSMSFPRSSCLNKHRLTHMDTSEREAYVCQTCDKTFSSKSNLDQHLKLHTGERPYQCTQCEKGFNAKSHLADHLRTHSQDRPFACNECEKKFKHPVSLNKHVRGVHSLERPYKCDQCDKKFVRKDYLSTHRLKHSKAKTHYCAICDKYYGQKSNLNTHNKKFHSEGR
ncbi:zinc finger protein OZF isoform X2 [Nematostella vectensis]|uniref:zinc finger protein OZF isoform X2 n=1 Tax=Nematostella vectensis TaxID=45351 RepID=UPI0020772C0D|nr:zinc finger protein OZF isoform X2 [Nematostella vectensis]